jgi:hypothetical protein
MHPSLRSLTHDKLFHPSTEPSTLLDQSNFPPDHSHPINPDVREAAAIFVHELFELRLPLFRELELCRYEAEVSSRLRDDEDQYASAEFGNVPHNRRPIPLELDTPEGPQDRDVKRIRDRFAVIADPDWQPTLQPSRSSRKAVTDLTGSDRGTSPGTPQLDAIAM